MQPISTNILLPWYSSMRPLKGNNTHLLSSRTTSSSMGLRTRRTMPHPKLMKRSYRTYILLLKEKVQYLRAGADNVFAEARSRV